MSPITIRLKTPIEFGTETLTELTIRPVKAKDLRGLDPNNSMDFVLKLAGRLATQPDKVIDELTGEDLSEVIKVVTGFMPGGPKTGGEPSPS